MWWPACNPRLPTFLNSPQRLTADRHGVMRRPTSCSTVLLNLHPGYPPPVDVGHSPPSNQNSERQANICTCTETQNNRSPPGRHTISDAVWHTNIVDRCPSGSCGVSNSLHHAPAPGLVRSPSVHLWENMDMRLPGRLLSTEGQVQGQEPQVRLLQHTGTAISNLLTKL